MKTPKDILSKIESEIKYKRKSSIWNHFLTVIRLEYYVFSGEISNDSFKVWSYNHWTGIFHPVIHGRIYRKNEQLNIDLKSKLNPLGRLFAIIFMSALGSFILEEVIIQENNSWIFLWKRILVGIFIFCLPFIAFGIAYRFEYKTEILRIKNLLHSWISDTI